MTLEALKEQARAFSRQEQATLAAECEAIIDAVDSGKMDTVNGREFFAQLREELTA